MNNIYPAWWNTKVTVYNKYIDPQTKVIKWFRKVIEGTFWKYISDDILVGQTVLQTNNIICRIRIDDAFLEAYQWQALSEDEKVIHFTLQGGDMIIRGEVADDIDEYVAGKRSSDFLQKYKALQGCMTVQDVALNVGEGRGPEHYFVRGI